MIPDEEQLRRALTATPEQQQCLAALAEDLGRPPVYLVAGGTPAALALRERLDDPEFRAELEQAIRRFAEGLRLAIEPAVRSALEQARAIGEWAAR